MASRDKAAQQLSEFKKAHGAPDGLTTSAGNPIGSKLDAMTVGPRGPLLLQDTVFLDEISHFTRERNPERVVHAKGAGAFGYFEVTHDISKYCKAKIFNEIGKRTPVCTRFSSVAGERGSSDSVRDPRGFAVKFYTEEGNWDLTGNNTPIFFIRDPLLFPSFIHSQKRNPVTNTKDPDMFWDFITLRHECAHQLAFHFSGRGIPETFRNMNGYGSHTFKLVNAKDEPIYCKFHFKTDQGIKNLDPVKAHRLAADDPDYHIRELYNSIAEGNFPSWSFNIQVMTFDQAEKFRWNPFDMTKIWPQSEFPLIPVGKLVLNRNPINYFAEVEQMAFDPASLPPGIEPSPDKMLQGRLLAYADTHRHRLGTNYRLIPVNCPYRSRTKNYQRDGFMNVSDNQGGAPNYYPNSFSGPIDNKVNLESKTRYTGDVARYNSGDDDNYTQVTTFWTKVLKPEDRVQLLKNMSEHLVKAQDFLQERAILMWNNVHADIGKGLKENLEKLKKQKLNEQAHL